MRRLPVFFLIDVSESMIGEPVQQVEEGLATIIKELKRDPYALETVYLSVLIFAGKAKTVAPLTDIISFYPPRLPVGGGTSFGQGLQHLMQEMKMQLQPTSLHQKGDWRPIVFLFTDGAPTDDYKQAVAEWKKNWHGKAQLVAVSFGDEADTGILKELTDEVLLFKNTTAQAYKDFFKWITASIQATSQSVNMLAKDQFSSPSLDPGFLDKVPGPANQSPQLVDTNVATFLAKCSNTQKHYLIKYNRVQSAKEMYGLSYKSSGYRLAGSFAVGDDYFALSDEKGGAGSGTVNTDELQGFPHCPCCGNSYGFSLCPCGKLFCMDETDEVTCPWCSRQLQVGTGDGNFNVSRTKG
jgi:uncharacterized protein YegL